MSVDRHTTGRAFIELRNITKSFKIGREKATVLHDISLNIQRGEFLAIVGPSGSGKTTLTHIIGGLTKPDEGTITIAKQNLTCQSDAQVSAYRNKRIGFVFQNYGLLPHYSALENVTMPLALRGMSRKRRTIIAKKLLEQIGLSAQSNQQVNRLSGGQQQRVSIARALAGNPDIIIADEPTGSLDYRRGEEIATILQKRNKEAGVTLLVVTHNLRLAAKADHILYLHDGSLYEQEPHYAR